MWDKRSDSLSVGTSLSQGRQRKACAISKLYNLWHTLIHFKYDVDQILWEFMIRLTCLSKTMIYSQCLRPFRQDSKRQKYMTKLSTCIKPKLHTHFHIKSTYTRNADRIIGLGVSVPDYWLWGRGFESRQLYDFKNGLSLKRGLPSLMRLIG